MSTQVRISQCTISDLHVVDDGRGRFTVALHPVATFDCRIVAGRVTLIAATLSPEFEEKLSAAIREGCAGEIARRELNADAQFTDANEDQN